MVVALLWVAAIGLPAMLFRENFQHVRDFNTSVVADFGREMAKGMPDQPAVVLADDPARLYLAMGAAQSLGLPDQYAFVETRSLVHGEYLRYLAGRYPAVRKALAKPDHIPDQITDQKAGELLEALVSQGPVYNLYPAFGGFFERVSMTPHRLGVNLHPYPTNVLETVALSAPAIVANRDYWQAMEKGPLATLPALANRSEDARRIAGYYSQILDNWGVELQKMGTRRAVPALLEDANDQFAAALRLNPSNLVAQANRQYNAQLRGVPPAGAPVGVSDLAVLYRDRWNLALSQCGPADVPELDILIGRYFAQQRDFMQAAPLFYRSLELARCNPAAELDLISTAELDLINTYIDIGLSEAAFALIKDMRDRSAGDPLELAGVEALANLSRNDFAQADALLAAAHKKFPQNERFAGTMADSYLLIGERILRQGQGDASKEEAAGKNAAVWFKKALTALDEQLELLTARTAGAREISSVNRRRAEMQMALHDYPAAIVTLTEVLNQNPRESVPLLGRAFSELQIGRLDAAKSDYQALEKMLPGPSPAVYYGLAQVAQKQNEKAAEILYCKLYIQHAATNTLEFTNATRRLRALGAAGK